MSSLRSKLVRRLDNRNVTLSYVDRVVSRDPGENVVYWAFISLWSLLPGFLFGTLMLALSVVSLLTFEDFGLEPMSLPACIGFAILGSMILAHTTARYYTTEIAITNKQLITKPGIIARDGTTLLLTKCETCNLKQSILGRLLNYGSIVVSGAGDTNAVMRGISNPMLFQDTYHRCYRQAAEPQSIS